VARPFQFDRPDLVFNRRVRSLLNHGDLDGARARGGPHGGLEGVTSLTRDTFGPCPPSTAPTTNRRATPMRRRDPSRSPSPPPAPRRRTSPRAKSFAELLDAAFAALPVGAETDPATARAVLVELRDVLSRYGLRRLLPLGALRCMECGADIRWEAIRYVRYDAIRCSRC
jgi:hypothetical protein